MRFCDKKSEITISGIQAKTTIELCLKNARSFINDAEISIKSDKIDHISIPIEFALEEIGKAKIIFDKLGEGKDSIKLTEDDGFCVHVKKLELGANLIGLNAAAPEYILNNAIPFSMEELFGRSIFPEYSHKDIALEGHKTRLHTSFVDIDLDTKEPILDIILPAKLAQFQLIMNQISSIINKYPESFSR